MVPQHDRVLQDASCHLVLNLYMWLNWCLYYSFIFTWKQSIHGLTCRSPENTNQGSVRQVLLIRPFLVQNLCPRTVQVSLNRKSAEFHDCSCCQQTGNRGSWTSWKVAGRFMLPLNRQVIKTSLSCEGDELLTGTFCEFFLTKMFSGKQIVLNPVTAKSLGNTQRYSPAQSFRCFTYICYKFPQIRNSTQGMSASS